MIPNTRCENRTGRIRVLSLGLLLCLFFGGAISGCQKSKEKTSLRIAGIVFQEDQFFRSIELGMRKAAEKHNVDFLFGNSLNSLNREIELVDTYIANQGDAIVISPLSTKASVTALKRAHDTGIEIILYNTGIEGEFPACLIESDQTDLGASTGRTARKYVVEKLAGNAKIAMIEAISQVPEQGGLRSGGFEKEITKLPGVEIVARQDAWLAPQAADVVESILIAHPDINLIWASNEGGTVGAVTAVRNSGNAGKVVVYGTDMSKQLQDFLEADDNILQAVTGQKPFEIGFMAVEAAVKVLQGEQVEKKTLLPGTLYTRKQANEESKASR